MEIQRKIRSDGQWATIFRLQNIEDDGVFTHLCWDLIEYARSAPTKEGSLDMLTARFGTWQRLMLGASDLLPDEVIKGIVGELTYAKQFLHPKMTWDDIFASWLGPKGASKDFVFAHTWTEVKCVVHLSPSPSSVVTHMT